MLKQVGLEKQQNYILRKYEKVFKSGSQLLLTDGRCHINMRGFIIPLVPFTERRFIDMRNKKILFYFFNILCVVSSICLYTWKEKQSNRYMVYKTRILENDIQCIAINSILLGKINIQVQEKQKYIDNLYEKNNVLQEKYVFLKLLEQKSNEREESSPCEIYEKYFRLKQGELARRQGIETSEESGKMGFLNSHFGGISLNVDEGIYVQYYNSPPSPLLEDLLPSNLIITNPNIDLGFMNAHAGMDFEKIQENAYGIEINEGFMYNENLKVYYMEYRDNDYKYIFVSDSPSGSDSWLIICHIN